MSRKSEVITITTPGKFQRAVEKAAALLRAGEIVALPTETVYGLAANALDPQAVARIFEAKGRPAHNPVIVHVADVAMARECAGEWPVLAARLADEFWPGPLTLVVERADEVPDVVTAGGETVGLRRPRHDFFEAVIRECGFPLAAPSANVSNQLSPTTAAHVAEQMTDRVPLIVDGGACDVGIESTVVDATGNRPVVLRPGMIGEGELLRVWERESAGVGRMEEEKKDEDASNPAPLRSPGQLSRHYAPKAKLIVLKWTNEAELADRLKELQVDPADACLVTFGSKATVGGWKEIIRLPSAPAAAARALYASLHEADRVGGSWIVAEALPPGPEWRALGDRLKRASA